MSSAPAHGPPRQSLLEQLVAKSNRHLYSDGDLNHMVTTLTILGSLTPTCTGIATGAPVVIPAAVLIGVAQAVAEDPSIPEVSTGKSVFRNSCNLRVSVFSRSRGCMRTVALKVFGNMSLQITGAHAIDIAEDACDILAAHIVDRLRKTCYAPVTTLRPMIHGIAMANFKACLTDRVNMFNLYTALTKQNVLVVYDPSARDAASNVKIPFDDKMCSVRVFESGKMIISIPGVANRDAALAHMLHTIHTLIQPVVEE